LSWNCLAFNSLSRDHLLTILNERRFFNDLSIPSLGITQSCKLSPVPRTIELSIPSLGITKLEDTYFLPNKCYSFQFPLSGSLLSNTSRTRGSHIGFQFPLSGSLEPATFVSATLELPNPYWLSIPSLGITWRTITRCSICRICDSFNSLSRDHFAVNSSPSPHTFFQFPLSGSQSSRGSWRSSGRYANFQFPLSGSL